MLRIKQDSSFSTQQPEQQYMPLKKLSVEAYIKSFAADVTMKQIFRTDEMKPIEAEALQEYSDALQQGLGAYLLEHDEKSQNNFIISVGALRAGKECHIMISYVSELDLVQNGSRIRFVVPTAIAPRYNRDKCEISSPAGTTSKYVQTPPYTIEFSCQIEKSNISRVSSTSHPIQIDFNQENVDVIKFAQQNTHLDRGILLHIDLANNRSNMIITIESGAVMTPFTPTEEDCQHAMNNGETTNEFMFVIDCSGSME
ncbi:unnamed protein product, partial [Rotaria sp. Silwood1]